MLSLFWPALLHLDNILFPTFSPLSDVVVIHWPKAHLMAQSWQAGQGLPHWTPLSLSGMPLAANQLAMLSYPPTWLFLLFPVGLVFNLLFVFHLLLGGFGIYLLLRESHNLSPAAALLGGLTFALSGKWLAHVAGGHVSMVAAIGWMPWALSGVMMLLKRGTGSPSETGDRLQGSRGTEPAPPEVSKGRQGRELLSALVSAPSYPGWAVLLAAVALAMQIFTHTLLLIYTVYLMAAVVGWHFIFVRTGNRLSAIKRLWLPLLAIPMLAGLLGAAQLLPLLELVQYSNRAFSLKEAAEFALSPTQLLVGLFLPSTRGGHEFVIYMGLIPLLLAPFGLTRQNRWTWFYGALFIFTILFALGPATPVHSLFYYFVPGFRRVRTPARIFFVGTVAVAVLVGFGAEHLRQFRRSPTALRWLARLTVALSGLAMMVGLGLALTFGQLNRASFALAILIPAGLGLILLRAKRIISDKPALILMGLALFFDLASFDLSMMRFVPPEEALAAGRPAAEYLAQKPGYFRIYSPSYSLPAQTAAAGGLQLADGVEPVHLAVYDRYMARAGGYRNAGFSVTIPDFGEGPPESALKETKPNLKLLGLLNVVYLASAFPMDQPGLNLETKIEQTFIYRNTQALPRAWVTHQTIPAETDWLAQLESLPDLAGVVVVEESDPARREGAEEQPLDRLRIRGIGVEEQGRAGEVNITSYSADLIELETEIAEPGWLVLSEIWYPGWQAAVNGLPQPVERVNGMLRGLYLSRPGQYQIRLEYRPQSVLWGNRISGLTAGLMILFILVWFWLRRSKHWLV